MNEKLKIDILTQGAKYKKSSRVNIKRKSNNKQHKKITIFDEKIKNRCFFSSV
jgi:hypothetical protein